MSLTEKRILLLAAAVIRQADVELPVIRFDVSDYRRIYDIVNNLVNELLDIVSSITTRNIVLTRGRSSRASYSVVNTFALVTGPDPRHRAGQEGQGEGQGLGLRPRA